MKYIILLLFTIYSLISISQPCLISDNLVATPAPTNGTYPPGTTVNFCYTINYWDNVNFNYLIGVVPQFAAGWDITTLTSTGQPLTMHALNGVWIWTSPVTGATSGNTIPYPGWWFDSDEGVTPPKLDGDPGNNWGDGYNTIGNGPWTFCWEITTSTCPPSLNGDDLEMKILTHSDSEMGSWVFLGCDNDPLYIFSATLDCCPIIYTSNISHY